MRNPAPLSFTTPLHAKAGKPKSDALPLTLALFLAAIAVLFIGCGQKTVDAQTELDKAAGMLSEADAAPPAPEPQPAEPVEAIPAATPAAEPTYTPSQSMQQAITAYKSGELEDAVTRLQKLRATPTLTAQQRMAVQDSVAAVMTEIYELAAKGNTKAIQAVKQYEQMQTSRH